MWQTIVVELGCQARKVEQTDPNTWMPIVMFVVAIVGLPLAFYVLIRGPWAIPGIIIGGAVATATAIASVFVLAVGMFRAPHKHLVAWGTVAVMAFGGIHSYQAYKINTPVMFVSRAEQPRVSANIEAAQSDGYPWILHREFPEKELSKKERDANKREKRAGNCEDFDKKRQFPVGGQCDEYPFASTYEGWLGARIAEVGPIEHARQRDQIGLFYARNGIKDCDRFAVRVTP